MARPATQNSKLTTQNSRPYLIWIGAVLLAVIVGVAPPLISGGLLAGVDLTRFSDYQELEDLEYIERMKRFE